MSEPVNSPDMEQWIAASKTSWLRWPAIIGLAGAIVPALHFVIEGNRGLTIGPFRLYLFDAACIFGCLALATFPVWYVVTGRIVSHKRHPPLIMQAGACLFLLLAALAIAPHFQIQYREYSRMNDITTTWMKRSIAETIREPFYRQDELGWLQSNFSASYIPASVFCPRFSTRLYPLFGVVRDDDLGNALASGAALSSEKEKRPDADSLSQGIARCREQGPAMLAAGLTKESALIAGDLDRFFALSVREQAREKSIILEDGSIPAPIMSRVEAYLATYEEDAFELLSDSSYKDSPGQVRRLRPLAIAVALDRQDDMARLKRPH